MASTMTTSVLDGAEKFGFNRLKFYDSQTNLSGLIANLKKEIEASSSTNRLHILAAGPMEVLWRAVNASARSKRQYVTIISHSPWNNRHRDTPLLRHTDSHLKQLGVKWMQIAKQEPVLHTPDWSPWTWLQNAADHRLPWVHERMRLTGKADVSDAGMCYYLLTNDQNTTPAKLRAFFGGWASARLAS
jgi:hypothetical protein